MAQREVVDIDAMEDDATEVRAPDAQYEDRMIDDDDALPFVPPSNDALRDPDLVVDAARSDEFRCAACYQLVKEPVSHGCAHFVCRGCNDRRPLEDRNKCPQCRAHIASGPYPNLAVAQFLRNLLVHCVHKPHGCTHQHAYHEQAVHLAKCTFVPVKCKWPECTHIAAKTQIGRHEAYCEYKTKVCDECKEEYRDSHKSGHFDTHGQCMNLIVCPNECTVLGGGKKQKIEGAAAAVATVTRLPREQMEHHLANDCPKRQVACFCGDTYIADQAFEHINSKGRAARHVQAASRALTKLQAEVEELKHKLRPKTSSSPLGTFPELGVRPEWESYGCIVAQTATQQGRYVVGPPEEAFSVGPFNAIQCVANSKMMTQKRKNGSGRYITFSLDFRRDTTPSPEALLGTHEFGMRVRMLRAWRGGDTAIDNHDGHNTRLAPKHEAYTKECFSAAQLLGGSVQMVKMPIEFFNPNDPDILNERGECGIEIAVFYRRV